MIKRDELKNILSKKVLFLDGAVGTELFKRGFSEFSQEILLLRTQKAILELQKEYEV